MMHKLARLKLRPLVKTYQELKETITNLRAKGAKSFVIDVRQNPGGLLDQAERMASMFLKMAKQLFNLKTKRTYDERSCFQRIRRRL